MFLLHYYLNDVHHLLTDFFVEDRVTRRWTVPFLSLPLTAHSSFLFSLSNFLLLFAFAFCVPLRITHCYCSNQVVYLLYWFEDKKMASFSIPYVPLNANSWGPPSDDPNDKKNKFYQLPYAPFGKSHVHHSNLLVIIFS